MSTFYKKNIVKYAVVAKLISLSLSKTHVEGTVNNNWRNKITLNSKQLISWT